MIYEMKPFVLIFYVKHLFFQRIFFASRRLPVSGCFSGAENEAHLLAFSSIATKNRIN
jgi:hypothetical protein